MKLKMVTALVMGAAVSACSSSALMVEKAPTTQYRVSTANLVYDAATIPVEDGTQQYLQTKMKEAFLTDKNAVFTEGSELTVRYHFVGHNEGSRVGRWLTGGLAGGSKTYIEANFMDQSGTQVGSVRSEGSVGLGIAGGSAKSGIDGAVKKIAQYAAVTFKK